MFDKLASQPNDPLIGTNLSGQSNFQRAQKLGDGSFTARSSLDGKNRLYTFSRVANLPLLVVVALSSDEVYGSWRRTALVVSIATGVLCIGILWLSLLLGRELRRRHSAEQGLAALAATDPALSQGLAGVVLMNLSNGGGGGSAAAYLLPMGAGCVIRPLYGTDRPSRKKTR